jgi:hypothetical protein
MEGSAVFSNSAMEQGTAIITRCLLNASKNHNRFGRKDTQPANPVPEAVSGSATVERSRSETLTGTAYKVPS